MVVHEIGGMMDAGAGTLHCAPLSDSNVHTAYIHVIDTSQVMCIQERAYATVGKDEGGRCT